MKIDKKMIAHLEQLARIELSDEERDRLTGQIASIVEYVEQLKELDTEAVEPTSAVVREARTELRPDVCTASLDRDVILGQAPDVKDGFFRVPKIIERK